MKKGWFYLLKKQMSKLWLDGKFVSVTILAYPEQSLVRKKTQETDGYESIVVSLKKWPKNTKLGEFRTDEWIALEEINFDQVKDLEAIHVVGMSKGKWFQWGIKRFWLHGMPATHGHKFTRHLGSKGNRKPRRTQKWHPHAGHMWYDRTTIKNVKILDKREDDSGKFIVVKWSVPWHRDSVLKGYFI